MGVIPGDHIPRCRLDKGWRRAELVEQALQTRFDGFRALVAGFRRSPQSNDEQMLALRLGEQKRLGQVVEHVGRGRSPAPLLKANVPGCADAGSLGDFFTPPPRCPAAGGGKAERSRIELRAAVLEEPAECMMRSLFANLAGIHNRRINLRIYYDFGGSDDECWNNGGTAKCANL